MQPLAVAHARLNGMAKGMPKIQNGAQSRLALVLPHHQRFDLAAALHRVRQCLRLASHQRADVGLNPVQKHHVRDGPVFDDLGQTRAELALRQRLERVQVTNDALRLVKRANHVFPQRVVDGGFTAYRRIHLRQQGGGHLHKRHPAHVARGCKAGHVAHHTATQRKQHRFAVAAMAQQGIKDQVERFPRLVRLPVGQHHRVDDGVTRRQRSSEALRIQRRHGFVCHDHRTSRCRQAHIARSLIKQLVANRNAVTAIAKGNLDLLGRHGWRLNRVRSLRVHSPEV